MTGVIERRRDAPPLRCWGGELGPVSRACWRRVFEQGSPTALRGPSLVSGTYVVLLSEAQRRTMTCDA